MIRLFIFLLTCLCSLAHAQEFLDPAVAFKPSLRALDGNTAEVSYEIAKGYYLYRDKFRFAVEDETIPLGKCFPRRLIRPKPGETP